MSDSGRRAGNVVALGETKSDSVSVGARLSEWRLRKGLTQASLSMQTGIHISQLKKYEQARTVPGGEALAAIAATGVNLNWLLTGQGPMQALPAESADLGDVPRLTRTIAAVEEGLRAAGLQLPPDKYAELVAAAYQLMAAPSTTSAQIVQFIRAANT